MSTILITGGSGLVGAALTGMLLAQGHEVIIMGRKKKKAPDPRPVNGLRYAYWSIENRTLDEEALGAADYIVHLAGANVAEKRWTIKRKNEIVNSRTESSELIVQALKTISNKVRAVISASATGWYGPDNPAPSPKPFVESDPADGSFLGETTRRWEKSISPVKDLGIRLVILRIGIVLSRSGGALREFKKPVKLGIAGILGNGKQTVSWIHIDDLCRIFSEAITRENMHGIYNAVAPNPVNNRTLTLELARLIKGRFYIPVYIPSFALRIIFGEMSVEALKSTTVSASRIRGEAGFQFIYPAIESALKDLIIK